MAWSWLSITDAHIVYLALGGFTSVFMLCSLFIKEKLYIGEATVATIFGIVVGPSAGNVVNPNSWGNTDLLTLEFSRVVLVVQCFAVGVELRPAYFERHWKSMVMLLVPVMTWGWLMTSLLIWWMVEPLTWLESLICAACVTATDPVLASSVVGKGKFAKRIPKHLRDLLSAESGCNDGMAFPFIYLALFLARYRPDAKQVAFRWICYIILYECLFGAIYGFIVGYIARHAIKLAERKSLIDRESFLVFYFVLALFCAGSGSMLGMDDLLVGFAAGVGFSNDGWFTEKTEESHVSNVIDLLLNVTYFVYFGTVIPWAEFNDPEMGMIPWKLVVLGLFVLLFRRIPIMLALKPLIPDVGTWREALFAGHFGPIGVGAIFVAILARAELQTETTEPIRERPALGDPNYYVVYLIWPITCFLVILSIAIHGSSIAVFTLGKRINTLTLTLSYTQDAEVGRSWMERLPRISATNTKSVSKDETASVESNEKPIFSPGTLGPTGVPGFFLGRQKDDTEKPGSAPIGRSKRKRKWEPGKGPGGPISDSAIAPQRSSEQPSEQSLENGRDTLVANSADQSPENEQPKYDDRASPSSSTSIPRGRDGPRPGSTDVEVYQEGDKMVIEDEDGNVLSITNTRGLSPVDKARVIGRQRRELSQERSNELAEGRQKLQSNSEPQLAKTTGEGQGDTSRNWRKQFSSWRGWSQSNTNVQEDQGDEATLQGKARAPERKRGPAHAYQFGNNIIVEDEDGEVIRSYNLTGHDEHGRLSDDGSGQVWRRMSQAAGRMGNWVGMGNEQLSATPDTAASTLSVSGEGSRGTAGNRSRKRSISRPAAGGNLFADDSLRFTISHIDRYGHGLSGTSGTSQAHGINTLSARKYSAADFLREIGHMDPKAQNKAIEDSGVPEDMKTELRRVAMEDVDGNELSEGTGEASTAQAASQFGSQSGLPSLLSSVTSRLQSENITAKRSSLEEESSDTPERADLSAVSTREYEDNIPTHDVGSSLARYRKEGGTAAEKRRQRLSTIHSGESSDNSPAALTAVTESENHRFHRTKVDLDTENEAETAPEKRRRLGALGISQEREGSESEEDERTEPLSTPRPREAPAAEPESEAKLRVQWGGVSGKDMDDKKDSADTSGGQAGPSRDGGSGVTGPKKSIKSFFGKRA